MEKDLHKMCLDYTLPFNCHTIGSNWMFLVNTVEFWVFIIWEIFRFLANLYSPLTEIYALSEDNTSTKPSRLSLWSVQISSSRLMHYSCNIDSLKVCDNGWFIIWILYWILITVSGISDMHDGFGQMILLLSSDDGVSYHQVFKISQVRRRLSSLILIKLIKHAVSIKIAHRLKKVVQTTSDTLRLSNLISVSEAEPCPFETLCKSQII
jgi:hypothetical protein